VFPGTYFPILASTAASLTANLYNRLILMVMRQQAVIGTAANVCLFSRKKQYIY